MSAPLRIRQAARGLVIDQERRVLLVHFDFSVAFDDDNERVWSGLWACPGGGLDPGESIEDGLRRELREELGLSLGADDVGAPIWEKEHVFPMSKRWDGQHDTYYLVRVDEPFEPRPAFTDAELRAEHVDGMRWWAYDELMLSQAAYDHADPTDPHFAVFSPRRLGHLVTDLLDSGPPEAPIRVDPR